MSDNLEMLNSELKLFELMSEHTPSPAQVVQDTLKTLLINTAGNKPLTQADVSLLHFWLDQAIIEHRRNV